MQEAWINEIEGVGQAEINEVRGIKECNGVFIPSSFGKLMAAELEGGARFKGIVIENGQKTLREFPIIITKLTSDHSGQRAIFKATGNPSSE
ncbi:hypothetical protein [Halomonas sp. M4R1S46]|uniref:hypothetical protein n=1 Tax=Halomonas sp. M4R1S46 TaxID=2982692 RepID=UPI0021E4A151|nr:hypothetical protein [Halomonas sp. M4R1S46]UYG06855.1 hypothetical protein OCT48_14665 [Halomonas sp. M4R1S46]